MLYADGARNRHPPKRRPLNEVALSPAPRAGLPLSLHAHKGRKRGFSAQVLLVSRRAFWFPTSWHWQTVASGPALQM